MQSLTQKRESVIPLGHIGNDIDGSNSDPDVEFMVDTFGRGVSWVDFEDYLICPQVK